MTHLLLTLTPNFLPVGDVAGWPELHTAAESAARHFTCHKRGGIYVQPANLDVNKLVRHENIASRAGDTKWRYKIRPLHPKCTGGGARGPAWPTASTYHDNAGHTRILSQPRHRAHGDMVVRRHADPHLFQFFETLPLLLFLSFCFW